MARKTYRRKYSRKGRHTIKGRYTRKGKKYSRKGKKGGNGDKVNCCICGKEIQKSAGLIPNICLIENKFSKAHRICQSCWWEENYLGPQGFSTPGISHKCPGCEKKLPLTEPPKVIEVMDLT